jgi:hypothetical protein
VAVGAELPPAVWRPSGANPGVVDQQRDAAMVGGYPVRQRADLIERGQVGEHGLGRAARAGDAVHDGGRALRIAAVH